jgi:hypothetical protein
MKRLTTASSCGAAALLWSCVALHAAGVIGLIEALLPGSGWLPAPDAWSSGLLPSSVLLPIEISTLMALAVVAWNRRVRTGCFARAHPRTAAALRTFAGLYFAAAGVQLGFAIAGNGAEFWRAGGIPVVGHWALGLFLLVSARPSSEAVRSVRMPAEDGHQYNEADDVPHGDVPALAQPLADGFGFGKQVGYGDAR